MAVINVDERLQRAAADLWHHAPHEYVAMMEALASYVDRQVINCLNAPPNSLPNAQGRAQGVVALQQLLAECRAAVQTADNRRNS